ncbi:MAG: methyltransferase domain-containing protein [Candidatus Lokiarchaeota archaeon]|nr:methyltransferase domain-containing protein [Candidatus Lokiarchaeota archaeon]
MKEVDKCYADNEAMWDDFAELHYESPSYKTKEFLEGECVLNSFEIEELGPYVDGSSLLHLQCHFGLDTLSWARKGAQVTGVDISGKAIEFARILAEQSKLAARFIKSNIYNLPDVLDEQFDIIFTSYGVLCWLKDLNRWAEIIHHYLKDGGLFYIVEFHRFMWIFNWEGEETPKISHSYFHDPTPLSYTTEGSYAESDKKCEQKEGHEWAHTMSDVINALIGVGLEIQYIHEFPKAPFKNYPFLKKTEDGYYRYNHPTIELPLTFSIMAKKE